MRCDQALAPLLDTVFGLFTYAFLLRFAMQWLRAPFRNPLGQAVIALTDWAVKPVRRVLPGFGTGRLDARPRVARAVPVAARDGLIVGRGALRRRVVLALRAARGVELLKAALWLLIIVVIVAGDPVVDRARRPARRRAQRADVPLPRADPARGPADRRHARPVAADPDRAAPARC